MSDANDPQRVSIAKWAPSADLRRWLLIGVWAVALNVCLSAASLAIDLLRDKEAQGFTVTDGLDWAAVLALIPVLLAFLALGRETPSLGLWRSSIGVFGATWLSQAMSAGAFADSESADLWEVLTTVAVVVGVVCLFVLVSRKPSSFLQPAPGESPAQEPAVEEPAAEGTAVKEPEPNEPGANRSEKAPSKKRGWGCVTGVLAFTAARFLRKAFRRIDFDWGLVGSIAPIVILCCVLCCLLAFLVWFGISKIRLRHKLGSMAAVSGWADLVSAALSLAFYLLVAFAIFQAAVHQEDPDLYQRTLRIPGTIVDVFDLLWTALLGGLFLSVRGRVARPS
jgi:hypothetical protein